MGVKRNYYLDSFRGITIISMVIYHLFYDLVYIFGYDIEFYKNPKIKFWQISIAVSFFLISGISASLSKKPKIIKRGLILTLLGALISIVTILVIPEEKIIFGVLNGIGASMLFVGIFKKYLDKLKDLKWAIIFFLLFIVTYHINRGYLNLIFVKMDLAKYFYDLNLIILGFPKKDFFSSDYFPILPWILIYLSGYFCGRRFKSKNFYGLYGKENILSIIGRKSLLIYLSHQVIIYGILEFIDKMK